MEDQLNYDQPINDLIKQYDGVNKKKVSAGQRGDYTIRC